MADAAPAGRGGFGDSGGRGGRDGGRGRGRGGRGRGGRGGAGGRGGRQDEDKTWTPVTRLGRLVKEGKVKTIEEVYLNSFPIKEYQIVEELLGSKLKDEVMKVQPIQKMTSAGQRSRFKAFVVVGDSDGHIGLGVKVSKEVATAIRAAINLAKINCFPVRRGYWGNKLGNPHTIPMKVTGKCGSVAVRMIPAPKGTGIVGAPVPKKILDFAGIEDVYTSSTGQTKTFGNFIKATLDALAQTYGFLTPELWKPTQHRKDLYQEHTDFLQCY